MAEAGFRLREFSRKDTALLLGISEAYLGTLEIEHGMVAARNERGQPVYTAADIAILRRMGVGQRHRRLYPSNVVMQQLGLYYFGKGFPDEIEEQAIAAKGMQEREVERLRILRDESSWRRKVQGWRG